MSKKGDAYELVGHLNLCGVINQVTLAVELLGTTIGLNKEVRAGFEVSGKINRKDFGLNFSLLTEAGSVVVGDELQIHFNIEVIEQAAYGF